MERNHIQYLFTTPYSIQIIIHTECYNTLMKIRNRLYDVFYENDEVGINETTWSVPWDSTLTGILNYQTRNKSLDLIAHYKLAVLKKEGYLFKYTLKIN